jgi:hypothetical protein
VEADKLSIFVATFCFHPTAMTHFSRNGLLGKQQSDSAQREGRIPARAVQRRVRLLLDMCACRLTCCACRRMGKLLAQHCADGSPSPLPKG